MEAKLTLITPCYRQHNLSKIYESINFDKIYRWIIIYDTTRGRTYNNLFDDNLQIIELRCDTPGVSGNSQRNCGLEEIAHLLEGQLDGHYIYFLDDDNIIHPDFWNIAATAVANPGHFYTFNQIGNGQMGMDPRVPFRGTTPRLRCIDTAMYIIDMELIGRIRWEPQYYWSDGIFIEKIATTWPERHRFIDFIGAYYNALA
jgi:hypothetical protein